MSHYCSTKRIGLFAQTRNLSNSCMKDSRATTPITRLDKTHADLLTASMCIVYVHDKQAKPARRYQAYIYLLSLVVHAAVAQIRTNISMHHATFATAKYNIQRSSIDWVKINFTFHYNHIFRLFCSGFGALHRSLCECICCLPLLMKSLFALHCTSWLSNIAIGWLAFFAQIVEIQLWCDSLLDVGPEFPMNRRQLTF